MGIEWQLGKFSLDSVLLSKTQSKGGKLGSLMKWADEAGEDYRFPGEQRPWIWGWGAPAVGHSSTGNVSAKQALFLPTLNLSDSSKKTLAPHPYCPPSYCLTFPYKCVLCIFAYCPPLLHPILVRLKYAPKYFCSPLKTWVKHVQNSSLPPWTMTLNRHTQLCTYEAENALECACPKVLSHGSVGISHVLLLFGIKPGATPSHLPSLL